MNRTERLMYWTATGLVVFIFTASGLFKLLGGPSTAEMAKGVGGSAHLHWLGIAELLFAALFIYPRTGIPGTLLMIAYMGGAMAVHFVGGQSILFPAIIQILIWLAAAYRFPELRQRLFSGKTIYNK